jgi:hypothetical protein
MDTHQSQITLSVITLQLNGKKINNAVLDQIPRADICDLLVNPNRGLLSPDDFNIVCRFDLSAFLTSEQRRNKSKGYATEHIMRLLNAYSSHEEAFLYVFGGQLYCNAYCLSDWEYTLQYSRILKGALDKAREVKSELDAIELTLSLVDQGLPPIDVLKQRRKNSIHWALFNSRSENTYEKELSKIINEHGSWEYYTDSMITERQQVDETLKQYEHLATEFKLLTMQLIDKVEAAPFAILGV